MKRLIVCRRDPNCQWTRIVDGDDPRGSEAQAKHHAVHDRIASARGTRKQELATRLAVRAERGGKGSAAPAPRTNCACCELGLFGDHGKGHVLAVRA